MKQLMAFVSALFVLAMQPAFADIDVFTENTTPADSGGLYGAEDNHYSRRRMVAVGGMRKEGRW